MWRSIALVTALAACGADEPAPFVFEVNLLNVAGASITVDVDDPDVEHVVDPQRGDVYTRSYPTLEAGLQAAPITFTFTHTDGGSHTSATRPHACHAHCTAYQMLWCDELELEDLRFGPRYEFHAESVDIMRCVAGDRVLLGIP